MRGSIWLKARVLRWQRLGAQHGCTAWLHSMHAAVSALRKRRSQACNETQSSGPPISSCVSKHKMASRRPEVPGQTSSSMAHPLHLQFACIRGQALERISTPSRKKLIACPSQCLPVLAAAQSNSCAAPQVRLLAWAARKRCGVVRGSRSRRLPLATSSCTPASCRQPA